MIASVDPHLLEILVCPLCKGQLLLRRAPQALVCPFDRLAFPVRDGIPVMLPEEADAVTAEEVEALRARQSPQPEPSPLRFMGDGGVS